MKSLPVAVIGAGPVGLAAAAHLHNNEIPFILLENGPTVASNILSWRHIRVFSPWKYNIDKAARHILSKTNWTSPADDALPTGRDLYDQYLQPLWETPAIRENTLLNTKVVAVGRKSIDKMKNFNREKTPYVVQALQSGKSIQMEVRAVIDASGTWNSPNPIGSGGMYADGEVEHRDNIFYGLPDVLESHLDRYKNKSVLVVGSGHSSINVILELDQLKDRFPATQIHWVLRKENIHEVYGGQEKDALAARGALGIKIEELVNRQRLKIYTPFQINQIKKKNGVMNVSGLYKSENFTLPAIDEVISNTGSRPDFSFLREVRLAIDASIESVSSIASLIDPNLHSCGTVRPHGERELRHPDKDFYIVGSKSYGRAPTFLMATGYEQVRSIVAALAGDMEAASSVQLDLPETGVCRTEFVKTSCCQPEVAPKPGVAVSCCS